MIPHCNSLPLTSLTKRPLGKVVWHEATGKVFRWRFVPLHMGSPSKSAVVLQAAF